MARTWVWPAASLLLVAIAVQAARQSHEIPQNEMLLQMRRAVPPRADVQPAASVKPRSSWREATILPEPAAVQLNTPDLEEVTKVVDATSTGENTGATPSTDGNANAVNGDANAVNEPAHTKTVAALKSNGNDLPTSNTEVTVWMEHLSVHFVDLEEGQPIELLVEFVVPCIHKILKGDLLRLYFDTPSLKIAKDTSNFKVTSPELGACGTTMPPQVDPDHKGIHMKGFENEGEPCKTVKLVIKDAFLAPKSSPGSKLTGKIAFARDDNKALVGVAHIVAIKKGGELDLVTVTSNGEVQSSGAGAVTLSHAATLFSATLAAALILLGGI